MLEKLTTEMQNPKSVDLDLMSAYEICKIMNDEDHLVPAAVAKVLDKIALAVETIADKFKSGGRLIYMGAGTSGRLGVMDAVECVPTFSVTEEQVVGIIAGGEKAFIKAVEGAEDSKELAVEDLNAIEFCEKDVLVGLAASGRTPYVIGALEYATGLGAATISVSCNLSSEISRYASIPIDIDTGQEILTGSTRLKAGTAQKLVLNMLSTGAMVLSGKVYKNLMVDVQMTNKKLEERSRRIIMEATGVQYDTADDYLEKAHNNPKTAIVMILNNCGYEQAKMHLLNNQGNIRKTVSK